MRKLVLSAVAVLFVAEVASAELVEAVVARVGDRIITRSQYTKRLGEGTEELRRVTPADQVPEKVEAYRAKLLEDMIGELLLRDRADRLNISVSDVEVQDAIKRLKVQYGIENDEQFDESLKTSGLTRKEMEARLRDSLLTNKLFARELRSRDELSDRELRERYEREKDQHKLPERAQLREIVLLIPDAATPAAIAALSSKADDVAARARGAADFAALVTEYSEAPSKEKGGEIGEVAKGELMGELDAAVFGSAQAVIGPIRSRAGFHIIRVDQRLPAEIPSFDAVKDKLRKQADEETFQRDYVAYLDRLRKDAFVQINQQP